MKRTLIFLALILLSPAAFAQQSGYGGDGKASSGASVSSFIRLYETAPGAATTALAGAGAGNVDNGAHLVKVTCYTTGGQTTGGTASNSTTVADKTANGKIAISGIPTCSVIATGRKVYMTAAGGSSYWLLSNGTIADNTTTTLTANDADATLTASTAMPTSNTALDTRLTIGQSLITSAVPLALPSSSAALGMISWGDVGVTRDTANILQVNTATAGTYGMLRAARIGLAVAPATGTGLKVWMQDDNQNVIGVNLGGETNATSGDVTNAWGLLDSHISTTTATHKFVNVWGMQARPDARPLQTASTDVSITNFFAVSAAPRVYSGATQGTVSNTYNFYAAALDNQKSGGTFAFTNHYGLYVENLGTPVTNAGATVTNAYALYIAAQSGAATLNYSIYSAGGNNLLAGPLTLGTGTPAITIGAVGSHNQNLTILTGEELLTIAAAATTDTAMTIPAGAVVLSVNVRVTTVIPTAATFTVTGTTSGTTFNTAAVSTAATTTNAGTAAGAYYNGTAQTIRITPNAQPADNTGRVRVTVVYYVVTPPTS